MIFGWERNEELSFRYMRTDRWIFQFLIIVSINYLIILHKFTFSCNVIIEWTFHIFLPITRILFVISWILQICINPQQSIACPELFQKIISIVLTVSKNCWQVTDDVATETLVSHQGPALGRRTFKQADGERDA